VTWATKRLDEVCSIVMGQAPPGEGYNLDGLGWPLVAGPGDFEGDRPVVKKFTKLAAKLSRRGQIILGVRASIGAKVWSDRIYALGRGVAGLTPAEEVDSRYLWHWLTWCAPELSAKGKGATFKQVNRQDIGEMEVPVPGLAEQRRIADVLDRVDTLRAKRRAALGLLGAARTAAFVHMFGDPILNDRSWKRVALGALVERIHSGRSPICLDRPASEGEWAVLKLGAVTSGEFRPAENKALPVTVAPRAEDEVRAGDILFSRKNTRDLVAACVLVRSTPARRLMPDLMFRLELKEEAPVVAEYLHALLSYPPKRRTVQDLASGSAGSMPNISKANLATVAVEVPPLDLQREFASAISLIDKAEVVQRRALGELDALFASLQHRAFRGEL